MASKPVRLFIQIACHNEEAALRSVIESLPTRINGVDEIYAVVIDDGSTDRTYEIAGERGVDYIVRNNRCLGLAKTFSKGLEVCLHFGADIIVNIDGDNQHRGQDIVGLVRPVLDAQADLAIGRRDFNDRTHFNWIKGHLEKLGSRILSRLAHTNIPDTTCGLRAMNRVAAMKVMTINDFSYTLEMFIQAGQLGLEVVSIPIGLNQPTRRSRLFCSKRSFIWKQMLVMLGTYILYRPMRFFLHLAACALAVAAVAGVRMAYLVWFVNPSESQYAPITGMILTIAMIACGAFFLSGLLGAVLSGIRSIAMDTRMRLRNMELHCGIPPMDCHIVVAPVFFQWMRLSGCVEAAEVAGGTGV